MNNKLCVWNFVLMYMCTSTNIHYLPVLAKRLIANQIRIAAARWIPPCFAVGGDAAAVTQWVSTTDRQKR